MSRTQGSLCGGQMNRGIEYARSEWLLQDKSASAKIPNTLKPSKFCWEHFGTDQYKDSEWMSLRRYPLRAVGYVFWDDARIENPRLLSKLQEFSRQERGDLRFQLFEGCVEDVLYNNAITVDTYDRLTAKSRQVSWGAEYYEVIGAQYSSFVEGSSADIAIQVPELVRPVQRYTGADRRDDSMHIQAGWWY